MTISIHAPCGGDQNVTVIDLAKAFPIHAPVSEATASTLSRDARCGFQSTPPMKGRHLLFRKFFFYAVISIPPPCEGRPFAASSRSRSC